MPSNAQIGYFNQDIGNQRFVGNHFLDLNIKKYKEEKKFLFFFDMIPMLTKMKKQE
jgi:hypothetical protein